MFKLSSGSSRFMPVSLWLVGLTAIGITVGGCSDSSPTNSTAQYQSDNSGVIRGGVSPGDIDFEYRVTATSQPAGAIGGPFAIRGRNVRYEAGALVVDLSVVNLGAETHSEPISLTFLSLLPAGVTIGNPDAGESGAGATINFVFEDGDGMWAPDEESMGRPTNFVIGPGMSIGFVAQLNGSANGMGAIGGMVWNDANGDGVMDTTEAPVEGATIMLESEGASSRTAISGPDGLYRFDSLTAGFYSVEKTADSGMTVTTGNPIFITLVDTGGVVSSFLAANFGCQFEGGDSLSGSISGMVFNDANMNGLLDSGEVGVPGAEVNLSGSDSLYAGFHAVVSTDSLGHYAFSLTDSAMYTVTLTPIDGFTPTTPDSVSVAAGGSTDVVVDFGVTGGGTDSALCVSGHAFEDLNHNRLYDEDEPGLNGVVIRLYLWQAAGSAPEPTPFGRQYLSAKTDEDGAYLFENLEAGLYVVLSKKPSDYDRTTWIWGVADVGDAEGGCVEVNFGFIGHDEDDCDNDGKGHGGDHDGDDDDDDDDDDDGGRGDIATALRKAGLTQ